MRKANMPRGASLFLVVVVMLVQSSFFGSIEITPKKNSKKNVVALLNQARDRFSHSPSQLLLQQALLNSLA